MRTAASLSLKYTDREAIAPERFHMKNIKKTGWDDYPHPSFNPFFTKYPA
jgi:hypothetical protein